MVCHFLVIKVKRKTYSYFRGNGSVEFDEFVKVMGNIYERKLTDDEMRRAFKCFDTDDSGK
jgi:Ca2+-binding EF-hand superfamily protein